MFFVNFPSLLSNTHICCKNHESSNRLVVWCRIFHKSYSSFSLLWPPYNIGVEKETKKTKNHDDVWVCMQMYRMFGILFDRTLFWDTSDHMTVTIPWYALIDELIRTSKYVCWVWCFAKLMLDCNVVKSLDKEDHYKKYFWLQMATIS